MQRTKLDEGQIHAMLADFPAWSIEEGKLTRVFEFESYSRGVLFAVTVAHLAEKMDHHPELMIGYQRVKVAVNTHDVSGISSSDFELARRIQTL